MSDQNTGPVEKAESFFRRVLERVGGAVDARVSEGAEGGEGDAGLSAREVGEIASLLERSLEASVKQEGDSALLAPHHFKVLLTYEKRARLSERYVEALRDELKGTAADFIINHRYRTRAPVEVEVGSDLFAKRTMVKAGFDVEDIRETSASQLSLLAEDGRTFKFDLASGGPPVYIGRAAGNTVRLDHPSISRVHCSLSRRADGQIVIYDLDSSNGTSVNASNVNSGEARVVGPGDSIEIGEVRLVLVDQAQAK
jgi:hypothetical protein